MSGAGKKGRKTGTSRSKSPGSRPALKVAELFQSIQGETSWAGFPCSFIRLAGCNLSCRFCDTPYARSGGDEILIDAIMAWVFEMDNPLVCITGGEPLIQRGVKTLVSSLLKCGYCVLVETNGSLPIDLLPKKAIKIVDVKTPGSGESKSFLRENLNKLSDGDELKFVITSRTDFDWAARFILRNKLPGRCELLLSPAHGSVDPAELAGWIIESKLQLRLNIQLHKILWGPDARGV